MTEACKLLNDTGKSARAFVVEPFLGDLRDGRLQLSGNTGDNTLHTQLMC